MSVYFPFKPIKISSGGTTKLVYVMDRKPIITFSHGRKKEGHVADPSDMYIGCQFPKILMDFVLRKDIEGLENALADLGENPFMAPLIVEQVRSAPAVIRSAKVDSLQTCDTVFEECDIDFERDDFIDSIFKTCVSRGAPMLD